MKGQQQINDLPSDRNWKFLSQTYLELENHLHSASEGQSGEVEDSLLHNSHHYMVGKVLNV